MIQVLGLNSFTAEKEAKLLNEASFEDIIEFVFFECLPIIPFQVVDAFKSQGKFDVLKNHITNHLIIVIKMTMEFEHSYNQTGKSLMDLLTVHLNKEQDHRSYKDLKIISDFYDDQYYKPIKKGQKKQDHYNIVSFQEQFYTFTVANRGDNPLYSSAKKTFENVESYHKMQQKHLDQNLDVTTQILIESKYNFNYLKDMSKRIAKTKNLDVTNIKIIAIGGLLPNVFSRTEFIDVLSPYSKICVSKINTLNLLNKFFKHKESNIPRNTIVKRANKATLTDQFSVERLIGNELNEYMQSFQRLESEKLLEGWLISLFRFVFPLMEMYAYYLVKEVFNLELDKIRHSCPHIDAKEDAVLDSIEIEVFNMLAPIMYHLKKLKYGINLPINDELIAPDKISTTFLHPPVSNTFFEHETLQFSFNAFVASQKIVTDTQDQIDQHYFNFFKSDQIVRSLEKARNIIKHPEKKRKAKKQKKQHSPQND